LRYNGWKEFEESRETMSYQALYRVWRPQRFEDVAGQTAITQTLKNALSQNKTSHAYLFTGPRGTGKTSAAKIFAKAINCPHANQGEPCNECDICQQITQGSLGDVIEIDAASNNGVEEIRDIREKANYAPTQAGYKVYIIDEVHMLSMGAFNALLKTLEEPPTNVIFLLATTEPHKIPLTIISRTQRFDFRRISPQDIVERMRYILGEKSVDYEEDALLAIAKAAEGGMRDALSILDQALSFADGKLIAEDALRITGSITQELLVAYLEAIRAHTTEEGLNILHELIAEGKDATRFVEDVILFSRDILLYQNAPSEDTLLKIAKVDERFDSLSKQITAETLYEVIRIFNQTQQELRLSNHAEVYLEVATVRLTQRNLNKETPVSSTDGTQVAQQVDSQEVAHLKQQLAEMKSMMQEWQNDQGNTTPASQPKKPKRRNTGGVTFKVNQAAVYRVLENATKEDLVQLRDVWPDLINVLQTSQKAIMNTSTPVAASPQGLVVTFDYDILCERAQNDAILLEAIENYLEKVIGRRAEFVCVPAEKWPEIRKAFIHQMKEGPSDTSSSEPEESKEEVQQEEEIVTKAVEMFGQEIVRIEE
jgi:DNA polymerase-3 subunit gamma/tau